MSSTTEQLKTIALQRIEAAEAAARTCAFEQIKEDLGELAQYLDTSFFKFRAPPSGLKDWGESDQWNLSSDSITVFLRLPDLVEILVQYIRQDPHGKRAPQPYLKLNWIPLDWRSSSRGRDFASGKFGVVKYRLNSSPPEKAFVQIGFDHEWIFTSDWETAQLAAKKHAREKEELEESARKLIRDAKEEIRRRFE